MAQTIIAPKESSKILGNQTLLTPGAFETWQPHLSVKRVCFSNLVPRKKKVLGTRLFISAICTFHRLLPRRLRRQSSSRPPRRSRSTSQIWMTTIQGALKQCIQRLCPRTGQWIHLYCRWGTFHFSYFWETFAGVWASHTHSHVTNHFSSLICLKLMWSLSYKRFSYAFLRPRSCPQMESFNSQRML